MLIIKVAYKSVLPIVKIDPNINWYMSIVMPFDKLVATTPRARDELDKRAIMASAFIDDFLLRPSIKKAAIITMGG